MKRFTCIACAYRSRQLLLGCGESAESGHRLLVSCAACKTLRVVDSAAVPLGCRSHRRPFLVHDDESAVACPRCAHLAELDMEGFWD